MLDVKVGDTVRHLLSGEVFLIKSHDFFGSVYYCRSENGRTDAFTYFPKEVFELVSRDNSTRCTCGAFYDSVGATIKETHHNYCEMSKINDLRHYYKQWKREKGR